jgi:hypothetical protein
MTGFSSWYSGTEMPTPFMKATMTTARMRFMTEPMAMIRNRSKRVLAIMSSGATGRSFSNMPSPRSLT